MTSGIIYIATGQPYTDEALVSAASVRRHMPTMPITLFSDLDVTSPDIDSIIHIEHPNYGLRDKVQFMKQSPYERTLFLDTDTYICADITTLFSMLDRFEIAAVHESGHLAYRIPEVPDMFPEYNSGVVLYRRTERVLALFDAWRVNYDKSEVLVHGRHLDQPTLRKSLYESDLAIGTLTSHYNCRFIDGGYVKGEVKILHRRSSHDFDTVERVLNSYQGQRVYIGDRVYKRVQHGRFLRRHVGQEVGVFGRPYHQLLRQRFKKYRQQYGLWGTFKRLLARITNPTNTHL